MEILTAPGAIASVVVQGLSVFTPCFVVVAGFAQRLPVAFVPEKLWITAVRDDVVNDRCGNVPSMSFTLRA